MAHPPGPMLFRIGTIVNDGQIDENRLLQAHQLARTVFQPDVPENEHSSVPQHRNMDMNLWRERISVQRGNVVYATSPTRLGVPDGNATLLDTSTECVIGAFLNYPRWRDGLESYHIFISAIHPAARGKGLFHLLLDATKDCARAAGHKTLTVSTVPEKFGRMYSILSQEGSAWEVVKWDIEAETGARKVLMKMTLDGNDDTI